MNQLAEKAPLLLTRGMNLSTGTSVMRLNWGCGPLASPGWINSDQKTGPGILTCDIRHGVPIPDNTFDYAVSIHALQEVAYDELVPVLQELRRVLKAGGTLRLTLPDFERGIQAYLTGDRDYFLIPDEHAKALSAKLCLQLTWYSYSRTLFTKDFIVELLDKAGFLKIVHCDYRETKSNHSEIVELDNRPRESLFVEATK